MSPQPVYIVWNEPVYRDFVSSPRGPIGQDMAKRGEKLRVYASRQVGKKTGRLAASIHWYLTPTAQGVDLFVGSDNSKALLVHEGTRPHIISGHGGQLVRFVVKGRVVYVHQVHHPGTRPNRYLSDNLRRVVLD